MAEATSPDSTGSSTGEVPQGDPCQSPANCGLAGSACSRVFVTRDVVLGDLIPLDLTPLQSIEFVSRTAIFFDAKDRGDAVCQCAASRAKMSGAYIAWLSSHLDSIGERLKGLEESGGERHFRTVDGSCVAGSWGELMSDAHTAPINLTEYGELQDVPVWTASASKGDFEGPACDGWISSTTGKGIVGHSNTHFDAGWTYAGKETCSSKAGLYCLQIGESAAEHWTWADLGVEYFFGGWCPEVLDYGG